MPLPQPVTIKFDLYTLACSQMLVQLGDLHDATQFDLRLDEATCLGVFDDALQRFFMRAAPRTLVQACDQFGALLLADMELLRAQNSQVASVFQSVVSGMQPQAVQWRGFDDVHRWHMHGRSLAQRFFTSSAWPTTQGRLTQTCLLRIDYNSNDGRIGTSDMRLAPAATRSTAWHNDDQRSQVLVRFDFRHTFAAYLSYPLLFLHEYTAHIFAMDWENDIFNDGWMLYAADAFLTRAWNTDADGVGLVREQVKIFQNYWYPGQLNALPLRGCNLARDLESWLSAFAPDRFAAWTFELAAFAPTTGMPAMWPTQFIFALEHAFRTDRSRLRHLVQSTATARALWAGLG